MPERGALVAVLIMERPLCVTCISEKSGITIAETEALLTRIEGTVSLTLATDRCRACGEPTEVYWLSRRD
jgi:hypothetical protein